MNYVLGICFTEDKRNVLLIKKQSPEWQKGRFNFPGGKIEAEETPIDAVIREFEEETNINSDENDWTYITELIGPDWNVSVFGMKYNAAKHGVVVTKTKEQVSWFICGRIPVNRIDNIAALIELASIQLFQNTGLHFATLIYGR